MSAAEGTKRKAFVGSAFERFAQWAGEFSCARYDREGYDTGEFVQACLDVATNNVGAFAPPAHGDGAQTGSMQSALRTKWSFAEADAMFAEKVLWYLALRCLLKKVGSETSHHRVEESSSDDEDDSAGQVTCEHLKCWCVANYHRIDTMSRPEAALHATWWHEVLAEEMSLRDGGPEYLELAKTKLTASTCAVQLMSGRMNVYDSIIVAGHLWNEKPNHHFSAITTAVQPLADDALLRHRVGDAADEGQARCVLLLSAATHWCERDVRVYHANVVTLLKHGKAALQWLHGDAAPIVVKNAHQAFVTDVTSPAGVAETLLHFAGDSAVPERLRAQFEALENYLTKMLTDGDTDPVLDIVRLGGLARPSGQLQRPYDSLLQHCASGGALPAPQWLCAVGALPLLLRDIITSPTHALYMQVEMNVLHSLGGTSSVKDRLSNVYACEARRCFEMARCYARDFDLFKRISQALAKGANGTALQQRLLQVMDLMNLPEYFHTLTRARSMRSHDEKQAQVLAPLYLLTLQTLPLVSTATDVVARREAPDVYVSSLLSAGRALEDPIPKPRIVDCLLSPVMHTADASILTAWGYKGDGVSGTLRVMGCSMLHYVVPPPKPLMGSTKRQLKDFMRKNRTCGIVFTGNGAFDAVQEFKGQYPHCAVPCAHATDGVDGSLMATVYFTMRGVQGLKKTTTYVDKSKMTWTHDVLMSLPQACVPKALQSAPRALVVMDCPAADGVQTQYRDCARIVDADHRNVLLQPSVEDDFWQYARQCADFAQTSRDAGLMHRVSTFARGGHPGGGAAAAGDIHVLPRCIVAPTSTMHWLGVRRPVRPDYACWGPDGDLALPCSSNAVGHVTHGTVVPLAHPFVRVNGNHSLGPQSRRTLNNQLDGGEVWERLQASIYTGVLPTHQHRGCMIHGSFYGSCEYCMMTRMQDDAAGMAPVHWSSLGVRQQYERNFKTATLARRDAHDVEMAFRRMSDLCGRPDLSVWEGHELASPSGGSATLFREHGDGVSDSARNMLGVTPLLHAHMVLATMPRLHSVRAASWDVIVSGEDALLLRAYGIPRARLRALRDIAFQVTHCWRMSGSCVFHKRRYTSKSQSRTHAAARETLLLPHVLTPKYVLSRGADMVPVIARTKEDVLHVDLMWAQARTNNQDHVNAATQACSTYVQTKGLTFAPASTWVPLLYDASASPESPTAPFFYCYATDARGKRTDTYGAIPALYVSDADNTYTSYVTLHESRYNGNLSREHRGTIMTHLAKEMDLKLSTTNALQDVCKVYPPQECSIACSRVALIHSPSDITVAVVERVSDFFHTQNSCTVTLRGGEPRTIVVRYGTPHSALPCTDVFERLLWEYNLSAASEGPLVPPLSSSAGDAASTPTMQIYGRVLDIADAGSEWPVVSEADKLRHSDADDVTAYLSPSNVQAMLCHNPTYVEAKPAADGTLAHTIVDRARSTRYAYGMEGAAWHSADAPDMSWWRSCNALLRVVEGTTAPGCVHKAIAPRAPLARCTQCGMLSFVHDLHWRPADDSLRRYPCWRSTPPTPSNAVAHAPPPA